MLPIFDFFRDMDMLAVTSRLVLAMICGGLIGIEREIKRRPAGFRTHILICMGSAITILTNLYLYQVMHLYTDISRMGAGHRGHRLRRRGHDHRDGAAAREGFDHSGGPLDLVDRWACLRGGLCRVRDLHHADGSVCRADPVQA